MLGAGRPGRRAAGASAMFYSGLLTEGGRKETDMREAASLRQQRRMKQAVQFIHKDSADLLPLDGLKKLGSSKDTVSSPPPATPASGLWAAAVAQALAAAFTESPARPVAALTQAGARQGPSLSHFSRDLACSPSAQPPSPLSSPQYKEERDPALPHCPLISFPPAYSESRIWLPGLKPRCEVSAPTASSQTANCVSSPMSQR